MKQSLRVWVFAARPFSLTAAVVPVVVGTVLAARQSFQPLLFLAALGGSVIIQVGTNLINDYYDFSKGVDTAEALGPSGVLKRGLLSPRAVLWGGIGCFAAGSLIGLLLVALRGLPLGRLPAGPGPPGRGGLASTQRCPGFLRPRIQRLDLLELPAKPLIAAQLRLRQSLPGAGTGGDHIRADRGEAPASWLPGGRDAGPCRRPRGRGSHQDGRRRNRRREPGRSSVLAGDA